VRQQVNRQLKQLTGNLEVAIHTMSLQQPQQQQQQQQQYCAAAKHASPPRASRNSTNLSPRKSAQMHAVVSGGVNVVLGSSGSSASGSNRGSGRQQCREDDTSRQHDVDCGLATRTAAAAASERAGGSNGASRLLFSSSGGSRLAPVCSNGGGQQQQMDPSGGALGRGRSVSPSGRGSLNHSSSSGAGVKRAAAAGNSSSCRGSTDSWTGGVWKPAGVASASKGVLSPLSPAARAASWGGGGVRASGKVGGLGVRGVGSAAGGGEGARGLNDSELDVVLRLLGSLKGQR
jgi:hypothetical protein